MQPENLDVEKDIQRALANASATTLGIFSTCNADTPLTVNDARCIIACLENPRFDTLDLFNYSLHDDAVLNVFRVGLPLCTSLTTVKLQRANLGNEDLDRLQPAFYNTSIRNLTLRENEIEGQRGGKVLRDLLIGNDTIVELILFGNRHFGPEGAIGLGAGMTGNDRLQKLVLSWCHIENDGLASLLPADGTINNSLMTLYLNDNGIHGADGGRQVSLLLQRFPALKVLNLNNNNLGPLGARALAPGLAGTSHLESLQFYECGLGNDGVGNLIPDGQENRSLTNLDLSYNDIEGEDGGRKVTLLLQRVPKLKVLDLSRNRLGPLGACALAPGLAAASHLERLELHSCRLGNDGVANLFPNGHEHRSLTNLNIANSDLEGADGGRQISLLLQRFPTLKVLDLNGNSLGPLGAQALAPGLAASHLESLYLQNCNLGNDGVVNLVPHGQVNRSLKLLHLGWNGLQGTDGGESVVSLAARCTNLDCLDVDGEEDMLNLDQQRRLDLLLDRKRLCTEASVLAGSTFSVLFHFVENAHRHDHGLSAIFVILQNDGDDYFCIALNRAIE